MKHKRTASPRQLVNLEKGRRILAQNQLRKMGVNINQKPQIIREVVRQPVVNQVTTHQHNINVQLSLFNKLLETKLFTLEVDKNKERLNFYEIINNIYSKLNNHQTRILSNEDNIQRIIDFINSKRKEDNERFKKIEKRLSDLEKENSELKKQLEDIKNGKV